MFDSQNSRGKALYPHDLLKAFHLRAMQADLYEMEHSVKIWEDKNPKTIKEIFGDYLFAICNWTRCQKTYEFTDKSIDMFKGADLSQSYSYAVRAFKSSPVFQINEPFIVGKDFFAYVEHYIQLLSDIRRMLEESPDFAEMSDIIKNPIYRGSVGFKYCSILFYCAVLCYYDRFHCMDKMAITRLFIWSFMLRVDMRHLGFDTINLYAIGYGNDHYSNHFQMFSRIVNARTHTEISNLSIACRKNDKNADKWNTLGEKLIKMNGR